LNLFKFILIFKFFSVIQVVEEVSRNKVPPFRRSLVFEAITQNDKDEDVEVKTLE